MNLLLETLTLLLTHFKLLEINLYFEAYSLLKPKGFMGAVLISVSIALQPGMQYAMDTGLVYRVHVCLYSIATATHFAAALYRSKADSTIRATVDIKPMSF